MKFQALEGLKFQALEGLKADGSNFKLHKKRMYGLKVARILLNFCGSMVCLHFDFIITDTVSDFSQLFVQNCEWRAL